jgi:DNA-binding Lrp family transcriptional regulator
VKDRQLKEVELRLIAELMKNSRRSDRELAKAVGTSQPTITRIKGRLEKEGYIREYTMIPDFAKIGFKLLTFTFVRLKKTLNQEQIEKARKIAQETMKTGPFGVVMLERGIGLDSNGLFVAYHKDYSSYLKFIKWLKSFDFLDIESTQSFQVDLEDKVRYRPWTYSSLANLIEKTR